jgi:cytochrome b
MITMCRCESSSVGTKIDGDCGYSVGCVIVWVVVAVVAAIVVVGWMTRRWRRSSSSSNNNTPT